MAAFSESKGSVSVSFSHGVFPVLPSKTSGSGQDAEKLFTSVQPAQRLHVQLAPWIEWKARTKPGESLEVFQYYNQNLENI